MITLSKVRHYIESYFKITLVTISVTRLGDFVNFMVTNFATKVAQMFGDFWDSFENHHFLS